MGGSDDVTNPSNTNPNPLAGPATEPAYPYPQQGYPQQPVYPPPSQPLYPPQAQQGYPPHPGYPQAGYPQSPYPQSPYPPQGYPQQQPYPQPQYQQGAYPPPGYPQPYAPYGPHGTPQVGFPHAGPPARATNPLAKTALVYGAIIFGVNFIGLFAHFYFIGFTAIYAIVYGVRALRYGARLPGNPGSAMAIVGIVLASLALVITVLGLAGL